MARYPVDSPKIISGYGVRPTTKGGILDPAIEGHWGLDLYGQAGTPVRAPEDMTVTAIWVDDATPPWVGYGPGGIEASGASGVFHLLGHLDPDHLEVSVGDQVHEGEQVGVTSVKAHVHWEVRHVAVDNPDTREGDTEDPQAWLQRVDPGGVVLKVSPPANRGMRTAVRLSPPPSWRVSSIATSRPAPVMWTSGLCVARMDSVASSYSTISADPLCVAVIVVTARAGSAVVRWADDGTAVTAVATSSAGAIIQSAVRRIDPSTGIGHDALYRQRVNSVRTGSVLHGSFHM